MFGYYLPDLTFTTTLLINSNQMSYPFMQTLIHEFELLNSFSPALSLEFVWVCLCFTGRARSASRNSNPWFTLRHNPQITCVVSQWRHRGVAMSRDEHYRKYYTDWSNIIFSFTARTRYKAAIFLTNHNWTRELTPLIMLMWNVLSILWVFGKFYLTLYILALHHWIQFRVILHRVIMAPTWSWCGSQFYGSLYVIW